jgi:hypothetical protein
LQKSPTVEKTNAESDTGKKDLSPALSQGEGDRKKKGEFEILKRVVRSQPGFSSSPLWGLGVRWPAAI